MARARQPEEAPLKGLSPRAERRFERDGAFFDTLLKALDDYDEAARVLGAAGLKTTKFIPEETRYVSAN